MTGRLVFALTCLWALPAGGAGLRDAQGLKPSAPLVINGDEDFEDLAAKPGSGVTGGPGSDAAHPFVIENLLIRHDAEAAIAITGTTAHFVIRNVHTVGVMRRLRPSRGLGLALAEVENGVVQDCLIEQSVGLSLRMGYKNRLENILVRHGTYVLYDTNRTDVIGCEVEDSLAQGFMCWHAKKNLFRACQARRVLREGIAFNGSAHDNQVLDGVWDRCVWAGISLENSARCVLRGNRVSHSRGYGLVLAYGSDDLVVENNTVTESGQDGIQLQDCRGARIVGNTVHRSGAAGLWLLKSRDSLVEANTITTAHKGIAADGEPCEGLTLKGNDVSLCMFGLAIEGRSHRIEANRLHENRNGMTVKAPGTQIVGNLISDHIHGISLAGQRCVVEKNELRWNGQQISVQGTGHVIRQNVLRQSAYGGFVLAEATDTRLENNTIEASLYSPAIELKQSSRNTLVGNEAAQSSGGIRLADRCDGNTLRDNRLISNDFGISLEEGSGNQVVANMLLDCDRPLVIPPKWLQLNTVKDNPIQKTESKGP